MKRIALFLFAAASVFAADVIPSNRLPPAGTWQAAGIQSGYPVRTHVVNVGVEVGGTTDQAPVIQAAVDAAADEDILQFPEGVVRIASRIHVGHGLDGHNPQAAKKITFRGVMSGNQFKTIWDFHGGDIIFRGQEDTGNTYAVTGSVAAGEIKIPIDSSAAGDAVLGKQMRIYQANSTDPNLPVLSTNGDTNMESQHVLITGTHVEGSQNYIDISPALIFPLHAAQSPEVVLLGYTHSGVGIEDIELDCTNRPDGSPMLMVGVTGCWLRNVWVHAVAGYSVDITACVQNTIENCWIDTNRTIGPNRSGVRINGSSSMLVQNNVMTHVFPGVEINGAPFSNQGGSSGNVVAYNFVIDSPSADPELMGMSFASNHGGHTEYDLFEGNMAEKFTTDGYYGSTHLGTVARNLFWGIDPDAARDKDVQTIALKRFARNYNIVGNVLGKPGVTFVLKTDGTPSAGNYATKYIYQFNYPRSSNFGFSGSVDVAGGQWWADWGVVPAPGTNGFGELDLNVQTSTLLKGNYNYSPTNGIPAGEAITGGATIATSYYLASKPSFLSDSDPWPLFDATSPPTFSYDLTPAGRRWPLLVAANAESPALPTFSVHPADSTRVVGAGVTFTVAASGVPTPSLQWRYSSDEGMTWTNVSGATASSLTLSSTQLSDAGWYDCVATNTGGYATSNHAVLTVTSTAARTSYRVNNAGLRRGR